MIGQTHIDDAGLYQEEILEHSRHPRNKGALLMPTFKSRRRNMSCGDSMELFVRLGDDEKIAEVTFDGVGCAISQAAASMLTEKLLGMTLTEAAALTQQDMFDLLGVSVGPARLRCAILALETLQKGIEDFKKI